MVLTACGVDEGGEDPCPGAWCARLDQQVTQSAEAEHECARTDDCNRRDSPAVNPAGRSGTDGEGDAVDGGEKDDGRHSGGTNLDDDARDVRQHRMRDVADQADRGRTDQEAPENRTARWWFLWVISIWVVIVFPSWR